MDDIVATLVSVQWMAIKRLENFFAKSQLFTSSQLSSYNLMRLCWWLMPILLQARLSFKKLFLKLAFYLVWNFSRKQAAYGLCNRQLNIPFYLINYYPWVQFYSMISLAHLWNLLASLDFYSSSSVNNLGIYTQVRFGKCMHVNGASKSSSDCYLYAIHFWGEKQNLGI